MEGRKAGTHNTDKTVDREGGRDRGGETTSKKSSPIKENNDKKMQAKHKTAPKPFGLRLK